MVAELRLVGRGVDAVVGAAGTGKTFASDCVRSVWEHDRFEVHGAALSARVGG